MTTPIEDQLRDYFGALEDQALAAGFRPKTGDEAAVAPVVVLDQLSEPVRDGTIMSRTIRLSGAAAALVLVIAAFFVFRSGSSGDTVPAEPLTSDEQGALDLVDEWYLAYEAGDLAALQQLFPERGGDAEEGRGNQLELAVWDHAQGFSVDNRQCSVDSSDGLQVVCDLVAIYPLRELVGAPRVTVIERFTIQDGAIRWVSQQIAGSAFNAVNEAFRDWLAWRHPDDGRAAGCCIWESIEDARALGERRAELAIEWAAWLERTGCTWDGTCGPIDEDAALGFVEEWNSAFRIGDLMGLEAAYPPGAAEFENVDRTGQLQLAVWDIAQESANTEPVCSIEEEESTTSVTIRCVSENLQPVRAFVGAGPIGVAETFRVEATGIVSINQTWLDDWRTVDDPFLAWYDENHPDDIEIQYQTWDSFEDARASGERRAEAGREWAAWLDANGCVYDQPCEPEG